VVIYKEHAKGLVCQPDKFLTPLPPPPPKLKRLQKSYLFAEGRVRYLLAEGRVRYLFAEGRLCHGVFFRLL
jgi:hypothetical protein